MKDEDLRNVDDPENSEEINNLDQFVPSAIAEEAFNLNSDDEETDPIESSENEPDVDLTQNDQLSIKNTKTDVPPDLINKEEVKLETKIEKPKDLEPKQEVREIIKEVSSVQPIMVPSEITNSTEIRTDRVERIENQASPLVIEIGGKEEGVSLDSDSVRVSQAEPVPPKEEKIEKEIDDHPAKEERNSIIEKEDEPHSDLSKMTNQIGQIREVIETVIVKESDNASKKDQDISGIAKPSDLAETTVKKEEPAREDLTNDVSNVSNVLEVPQATEKEARKENDSITEPERTRKKEAEDIRPVTKEREKPEEPRQPFTSPTENLSEEEPSKENPMGENEMENVIRVQSTESSTKDLVTSLNSTFSTEFLNASSLIKETVDRLERENQIDQERQVGPQPMPVTLKIITESTESSEESTLNEGENQQVRVESQEPKVSSESPEMDKYEVRVDGGKKPLTKDLIKNILMTSETQTLKEVNSTLASMQVKLEEATHVAPINNLNSSNSSSSTNSNVNNETVINNLGGQEQKTESKKVEEPKEEAKETVNLSDLYLHAIYDVLVSQGIRIKSF